MAKPVDFKYTLVGCDGMNRNFLIGWFTAPDNNDEAVIRIAKEYIKNHKDFKVLASRELNLRVSNGYVIIENRIDLTNLRPSSNYIRTT